MKTTIAKNGQTWADLAVEHYGALEAVVDLAAANGAAVSDTPPVGTGIMLPPSISRPAIVRELRQREAHPGTLYDNYGGFDVFARQFTATFD